MINDKSLATDQVREKMKIVINALQYRPNGSGVAVNMRELFSPFTELSRWPILLVLPKDSPKFPCSAATHRLSAPCTYAHGVRRILFQSFILGWKYCKDAVLLTVDSKIPLILPRSCRLMPLITDLAVFRFPETYQFSRVLLWKLQYRYLCRRADHYFTISDFTRSEMTEILGIAPDKIDIIPCAAPEAIRRVSDAAALRALRDKYCLSGSYILFVGNFNPRKNLQRIIRAFDRWKFDPAKALKEITAKDCVRFIGFVPNEDMSALYSAAELFVFPTLYEGFGIPVIEAQKCGVPVLTSNVSSLPEVGGDGVLTVDPYDEAAIARGMEELLTNTVLREELIRRGFHNAERFSWAYSAQKLNQIIERLIENGLEE